MVNIPKTEEQITRNEVVKNNWYKYFKDLSYALRPSNSPIGAGSAARTRFWTNIDDGFPTPVSVYRMRERVFIGEYANSNAGRGTQAGSWMDENATAPNWIARDSQLAVVSDNGGIAISASSRTSDHVAGAPAFAPACVGISAFADGIARSAWGAYIEAWRHHTSYNCQGIEIDIKNVAGDNFIPSPYNLGTGANGNALWLISGGDYSYGPTPTNHAGAGIVIGSSVSSGGAQQWNRGIVYIEDGLSLGGGQFAMAMPVDYKLGWFSPDSTYSAAIYSSLGDSDVNWTQYWSGDSMLLARNNAAEAVVEFLGTASAANYLRIRNNSAGLAPNLTALGSDTDVSIRLVSKGAGELLTSNGVLAFTATAVPAGGTTGSGYKFSTTTNFGVFFGSGAPSLSAAKGSLYLRSDGSTTNDRAYINTNGSTTWTAIITVA